MEFSFVKLAPYLERPLMGDFDTERLEAISREEGNLLRPRIGDFDTDLDEWYELSSAKRDLRLPGEAGGAVATILAVECRLLTER